MPKKTKLKVPPPKDEAAPFERFAEFTKRIVAVPKRELSHSLNAKRKKKKS